MVSAAFYPSKVDEPMFADFWTLLALLDTPCLVVVVRILISFSKSVFILLEIIDIKT